MVKLGGLKFKVDSKLEIGAKLDKNALLTRYFYKLKMADFKVHVDSISNSWTICWKQSAVDTIDNETY